MVAASSNAGQQAVTELQPAVKELCRTLDGFVYVVDATATAEHSLYLLSFYMFFEILFASYSFLHFIALMLLLGDKNGIWLVGVLLLNRGRQSLARGPNPAQKLHQFGLRRLVGFNIKSRPCAPTERTKRRVLSGV